MQLQIFVRPVRKIFINNLEFVFLMGLFTVKLIIQLKLETLLIVKFIIQITSVRHVKKNILSLIMNVSKKMVLNTKEKDLITMNYWVIVRSLILQQMSVKFVLVEVILFQETKPVVHMVRWKVPILNVKLTLTLPVSVQIRITPV